MDNLYAHSGWWNEDVFLNPVWNILYSVHDVEINPDNNSWPYQNVDVIGVYYIHVDMFMTLWNENCEIHSFFQKTLTLDLTFQ